MALKKWFRKSDERHYKILQCMRNDHRAQISLEVPHHKAIHYRKRSQRQDRTQPFI